MRWPRYGDVLRARAIVLALLLVTCTRAETRIEPSLPNVAQPRATFTDRSLPSDTLQSGAVKDQARIIDAELRVRPDRRFLIAIGDVYEILTGKREEPEITFGDGRWTIRAAGRSLGTLPELPTFGDGLDLATRAAAALPRHASPVRVLDVSRFYAMPLFAAAKNADPASGSLDLAKAAALINLQTIDRFGLADPLRGRALALLAIARASHGKATDDLAALLEIELVEFGAHHRFARIDVCGACRGRQIRRETRFLLVPERLGASASCGDGPAPESRGPRSRARESFRLRQGPGARVRRTSRRRSLGSVRGSAGVAAIAVGVAMIKKGGPVHAETRRRGERLRKKSIFLPCFSPRLRVSA